MTPSFIFFSRRRQHPSLYLNGKPHPHGFDLNIIIINFLKRIKHPTQPISCCKIAGRPANDPALNEKETTKRNLIHELN